MGLHISSPSYRGRPDRTKQPAAVAAAGAVLNHMATPARLAEALTAVARLDVPPAVLQATQLRLAGTALARQGDLPAALSTFTQALVRMPPSPHPSRRIQLKFNSNSISIQFKLNQVAADTVAGGGCCY